MTTRRACLIGLLILSSCTALQAQEVEVFVRQAGGVSIEEASLHSGEAIIRIRNDSRETVRMILAKTTLSPDALPIGSGRTVDIGTDADVTYSGKGYEVIAKLDELAPFFARGKAIKGTMHVHLKPGTYVLFSNLPGHYESGIRVDFKVTTK